jgi:hypothetical protein
MKQILKKVAALKSVLPWTFGLPVHTVMLKISAQLFGEYNARFISNIKFVYCDGVPLLNLKLMRHF